MTIMNSTHEAPIRHRDVQQLSKNHPTSVDRSKKLPILHSRSVDIKEKNRVVPISSSSSVVYSSCAHLKSTPRLAVITMAVFIFLSGIVTGSLFCGMVTLPPAETLPHPSRIMLPPKAKIPLTRKDDESTSTLQLAPPSQPQQSQKQQHDSNNHQQSQSQPRKSQPQILLHPNDLKLPTPIIVMGLMKAGTTSIYSYFKCGLDPKTSKLSHYDCRPGPPTSSSNNHNNHNNNNALSIGMSCGKRMRRNLTKLKTKRPAFDTFDDFTLYAELDAQENNGGMTLPQWSYLKDIYEQFPNATWILNIWSHPTKWIQSVDKWQDLRQRFVDNAYLPDLPAGVGKDDKDMIRFYTVQAQRIREFVATHPSLHFVEVEIDMPNAGQIMQDAFGITKECWGKWNVNNGTAIWTET